MPIVRKKQKIRIQSFNGGEDSTSESSVVQSPKASLLRNADIKELGKASQRLGIERTGDDPDSLVSHYTFDAESAVDAKDDNPGTETSIFYLDGQFGKAALFNGTNSKIEVPAATNIDISSMDDFTFTTWAYPLSDGQLDTGRIWTKGGSYAQVENEAGSAVEIRFVVDYDTVDAEVVTTTTIPIENWTRIEFIHNTDNSLDIVINGAIAVYSTDTSGTGSLVDDSSDVLVFGNNTGQTQTFEGLLDDFRIYNAVRTPDEYEQDKITGLTRYSVGETIDFIYRVRDTNLERLDSNQKGWTVIDSGFTADLRTDFVQAKDILFILNGTDNVHTMDSVEAITDEGNTNTDPPRTTFGAWAQNNRLFLSGSLDEAERDFVWFSNTLDPQVFDRALNVFKVRSGTAGRVSWLEPFKLNELVIYKDDAIFTLDMTGATPLTDWTLQPINKDVGCIAGRTVKDLGNDHIFLDNEGRVRLLSRTTFDKIESSVISLPIQGILDTINFDQMGKSTSFVFDSKYYLAVPTGTSSENNVVLVWDGRAALLTGDFSNGWSVMNEDNWNVSAFSEFEFGDNKKSMVVADNRDISLVYKNSGNTDNGSTIQMDVAGPCHDGGNRGTDKIWGPLYAVADSGESTEFEFFADIDQKGFESVGTMSLVGSAPILPIDLPFDLGGSAKSEQLFQIKNLGRGKTCCIKARHEKFNSTATFNEYELYMEERIPRA